MLWWLDYENIIYKVDEEIINNLVEKKSDVDFVQKVKLLKGSYSDFTIFEEKIREIFGEDPWNDIQANIEGFDDFRKKEFSGKMVTYIANGYLGNYITVFPDKNLVGIRMISHESYDHEDSNDKDGFANFKIMVSNLIE